jgi:redox-sensitive bicupin YhaK (pirin superfamily)
VQRRAALHAARLVPGDAVPLPDAPYLHLFVAAGAVEMEDFGRLAEGDAVRLAGESGQQVSAHGPAQVLVWEMHAQL